MGMFKKLFGSGKQTGTKTHDFQKAMDYLDRMHYSQWNFHHFEEANRLAGSPFTGANLKKLWDKCAEAGAENQALMLGEVFRKQAGG